MKKASSVFWGLIIIAVGVIFFGNNLELWNIRIFFKGWWTLFIIIPSIYGLFKKEFTSASLGISIGVLLLLASRGIIKWSVVGESFLPLVLIIVGLSMVFKPAIKNVSINKKGQKEYVGVFAGNDTKINDKFEGASLVSVFGEVTMDLTKAQIDKDVLIDCVCVFGGIDIKVPDNVNVKISGVPIFGGAENKSDSKGKYTINVNFVCIFGGIDIK